jgi:hypothetical protein
MSDQDEIAREKAAKTNLERVAAERRKAAKAAVQRGDLKGAGEAPAAPDTVTVRVLPMGHEKISMGLHVPNIGEAHYDKGERFDIARGIAQALEDRGFVEIEDAPPAK